MYVTLTRFFRRLSLAVAIFLLSSSGRNFHTQASYEINFEQRKEDYGLEDDEVFLDLTQTPRVECFYRCSTDCRCSAFHMFKDTNCQLLGSSQAEMTLQVMPGYTYYDIIPWKGASCPKDCCKQNPCLHGGTCEPPADTDDPTIRFRCRCRRGYGGKRCQYRIGCPGYLDIVKTRANGIYTLVNPNTRKPFQVYCRFEYATRDVLFATTLIQSFALQNVSQIRPFSQDAPINENDVNFQAWRLSKANMAVLASYASKWIASCNFKKSGWSGPLDLLQAQMKAFDIFDDADAVSKCINVIRMTIRSETCMYCKIAVTQTAFYPLHVNTDQASINKCGGTIPTERAACHEDSFGWYQCTNTNHSCTASPESTTQYWLE